MSRHKIYFGAGPAALPETVLQQAATAVTDYNNTGLSILEMGHREKAFGDILDESRALVRKLCNLSDDYEVLWLQGGGRMQFVMAPMNFLGKDETAGYADSGHWAHEAMEAAAYYGKVAVLGSSKNDGYRHLPPWPSRIDDRLSYVHITTNNTIYGTQLHEIPECPVPLIADMSSDIFSTKRDYSRCAFFYAVVQKNIGPAGVTLAVIRKDLLAQTKRELPEMLTYSAHAKAGSLLNTPPVFAIYTSLLTLRWIAAKGMDNIDAENRQKAAMLYAEIERNPAFTCPIEPASRSLMNVIFRGSDEAVEKDFLAFAAARNIEGIKGHRSVGGFRASLYNAVSLADTEALIAAMQDFQKNSDAVSK